MWFAAFALTHLRRDLRVPSILRSYVLRPAHCIVHLLQCTPCRTDAREDRLLPAIVNGSTTVAETTNTYAMLIPINDKFFRPQLRELVVKRLSVRHFCIFCYLPLHLDDAVSQSHLGLLVTRSMYQCSMKNRLSAFIAESIVDDRSPTIHVFGGLRSPPTTAFRIGSRHFQWLLLARKWTFKASGRVSPPRNATPRSRSSCAYLDLIHGKPRRRASLSRDVGSGEPRSQARACGGGGALLSRPVSGSRRWVAGRTRARRIAELALDETLRRDRVSLGLLLGALWRDRATPRVAGRRCVGGLRSSAIDRFSCPGRDGRFRSRALRCLDGRTRRRLCARRRRLHRRRWRCGRIRRHCSRSSVRYLLRPARIRAWLRIRGRTGRSLGRGGRPSARRGVRRWRTPRAFGYPVDCADCSDQERGEQESPCAVTTAFRVDRAIPTESARWPFFGASGRLAGERCCRRGWVIDSTRRFPDEHRRGRTWLIDVCRRFAC